MSKIIDQRQSLYAEVTARVIAELEEGRLADGSSVPLDEVKRHPSGMIVDNPKVMISPARPGRDERLAVAPADVLTELGALLVGSQAASIVSDAPASHLLVTRRERDVILWLR